MRKQGGQKTYVTDGRYFGQRDGRALYSFTADNELRFPDDTRCDLEYRGEKVEGIILSVAGFDFIIALEHYLADDISTAILYTAPWFLLEALSDRLQEMRAQTPANIDMVQALLNNHSSANEPDLGKAQKLLSHISQYLDEPLEYNEHQFHAVGHVLANRVSFIWGPPGTGKSRTLGLTAAALAAAGKSVLVLAHSNVAVDVAMLNIARALQHSTPYQEGKILRYGVRYLEELDQFEQLHVRGVVRRQHPQLVADIEKLEMERQQLVRQSRRNNLGPHDQHRLKEALAVLKAQLTDLYSQIRAKEEELVRAARVVGCTLSKATIAEAIYQRSFNTVMIDEASMAYIPHSVFAAGLAMKRIAIYGDFRQLAPIAQADTPLVKKWLRRDIFDEAGIIRKVNRRQKDDRLAMLQTQYRMHPAIADVPNMLFYNGQLENGPDVERQVQPIANLAPQQGHALLYFDTSLLNACCMQERETYSRFNPISALTTAVLAYRLAGEGRPIGIITPYNAQARLINRLLKDLKLPSDQATVATVHRFQGSERDIILFDTVESEGCKPGLLFTAAGDAALRLANVAISRTRGKFVLLANRDYLSANFDLSNPFRKLADEVGRRCVIEPITWSNWTESMLDGMNVSGLTYYKNGPLARSSIETNIVEASEEVAINWPGSLQNYHFSTSTLKQCNSDRVRFFITGNSRQFHVGLRNAQIWDQRRAFPFGVVAVDRKSLWLYVDPANPGAPVLHVDLPQTTRLLNAFWRLIPDEDLQQPTMEALVEKGKSPLGGICCPNCGESLWPATGRYGPVMMCSGGCGYTKNITRKDATSLARLMGITCGHCGGQVRGRSSYRGVFLGCTNYPQCHWTMDIIDLV